MCFVLCDTLIAEGEILLRLVLFFLLITVRLFFFHDVLVVDYCQVIDTLRAQFAVRPIRQVKECELVFMLLDPVLQQCQQCLLRKEYLGTPRGSCTSVTGNARCLP